MSPAEPCFVLNVFSEPIPSVLQASYYVADAFGTTFYNSCKVLGTCAFSAMLAACILPAQLCAIAKNRLHIQN